jgi:hypothetical protein
MRHARIPLGTLMVAVGILALDAALVRGLLATGHNIPVSATGSLHIVVFACGVLPMASLLLLAASVRIPEMLQRGEGSSLFAGFEVFGWATVLFFITVSTVSPNAIAEYARATAGIAANFIPWSGLPEWAGVAAELALASAVFTLPQLLVALTGGWLTRRCGLEVWVTRRSRRPGESPSRTGDEPPRAAVGSGIR